MVSCLLSIRALFWDASYSQFVQLKHLLSFLMPQSSNMGNDLIGFIAKVSDSVKHQVSKKG